MKKNGIVGVVLIIILVLGAVAYAVSKSSDDEKPTSTTSTTDDSSTNNSTDTTQTTDETNDQAATTITYSESGFSPTSITVKSGDVIEVKNTSTKTVQFESDPHPVHTDNTQLNLDEIAAGESKTFSISNAGTWGYHNHLNSTEAGEIIVQ